MPGVSLWIVTTVQCSMDWLKGKILFKPDCGWITLFKRHHAWSFYTYYTSIYIIFNLECVAFKVLQISMPKWDPGVSWPGDFRPHFGGQKPRHPEEEKCHPGVWGDWGDPDPATAGWQLPCGMGKAGWPVKGVDIVTGGCSYQKP